jgi:hypothetical protein
MNTLEILFKIAKYGALLPDRLVWCSLAYLVSGLPDDRIIEIAKSNVTDYYGTLDKAPAWLQIIAQAQPGKIEQACAEARAHLADELDAFQANNDNSTTSPQ